MPFKTILNNIGGAIKTVTEFVEDEVIDPISNQLEYGVNEFKQGNPAPVLNAMSLGMSGAMAPLTQAVRGVDKTEGTLLESAGNYVEDKTGIPSLVTQVAAGVLIPGPGEYKAAGKSIARGVKKAFPLEGIDNIFPPTPPAALATAGSAPQVQLNVSGGKANLTPQVMELTIKDPEFLEPLDKLGVREGIANTPANIKARKMLDKALNRLNKRRAKLNSDLASGRIKKGGSEYNRLNKKIREERYGEMSSFYNQLDQDPPAFKKTGEKHVDPTNIDVVAEQHHLAAKAQTEPFIEIMLEVGDPDDLVALHEYSRMLGVIMGNSKRNMLDAPGPIHRAAMAKTAKEKAGNIHSVFNAAGMEPNNAYVRNLLKDSKSADDVMRVFKKYANEYLIPQQNIAKKIVKNYLDDYSIKLTTSERNKFNKLVSELN
jgi:hypothetical protein